MLVTFGALITLLFLTVSLWL